MTILQAIGHRNSHRSVVRYFGGNFAYNPSLCASLYLFLRAAVLRRQLQNSNCIYFQEKKIGRFEGFPQFQWTDPEGQDVMGQGSFGAVFVIESTGRKDGDSAGKGETVVVKKLLFQTFQRFPLLEFPRLRDFPIQRFPLLVIPRFRDSSTQSFPVLEISPFRDSPFQRFPVFDIPPLRDSPFQRFSLLEIPPFRDSPLQRFLFQRFPLPRSPIPRSLFQNQPMTKFI